MGRFFRKPVREIRDISHSEALRLRTLKEKPPGLPRSLWRNLTTRGKLPCKDCGRWFKENHLYDAKRDGQCRRCKQSQSIEEAISN